MNIEDVIFRKYTPDFSKLLECGFEKRKSEYYFEKVFLNNEFRAEITVSKAGLVRGNVYDLENNDIYLPLRLENHEGAFVGEVKNAYTKILLDIREKCFSENFFVSNQGNRIADLVYEKYGDRPVFLWEDSPTYGVFKNPESGKWYGIIMYIPRNKLSKSSEGFVEVMNIKLDKDEIQELLFQDGFYEAYHMNKKLWITIALDETVEDGRIMKLIEESHSYTEKKKRRKT